MALCPVVAPSAAQQLPVADWTFAADADPAGGYATHFQFRSSALGSNSTLLQGHLVNRLSSGCMNLRPGGHVRGHSSGSPQTMAAPLSATTELSASAELAAFFALRDGPAGGGPCTPPPAARFEFRRSKESLRVRPDGVVGAGSDCSERRCLFQLLPVAGVADSRGWFHLRSEATGQLVRLAHASMPSEASWYGALPPRASPKTKPETRAAKSEAASATCPISVGARAGWSYNTSLWAPLVRASLAPWAEGGITPTVFDAAFSKHMYPGPSANGLPGAHVSIRDGSVYYKTNSDYRMPLLLDMLRGVSKLVRLPDAEFVAHLWDHPKIKREQPLPVLAHYVDEAHRDIGMPAPWSWDEKAHNWPQPFTKVKDAIYIYICVCVYMFIYIYIYYIYIYIYIYICTSG